MQEITTLIGDARRRYVLMYNDYFQIEDMSFHKTLFDTPLSLVTTKKILHATQIVYAEESNLHIPNSLLKFENFSWFRGFVKISTIWFSKLIKIILKLFLVTSSLIKWCLISMYFVLECWIRFLDKLIALVLSHRMGTLLRSITKSRIWCLIHKT